MTTGSRLREDEDRESLGDGEKGGLGGQAEIGKGPRATGRLRLPVASGRSSLSGGSIVERLRYDNWGDDCGFGSKVTAPPRGRPHQRGK